MQLSVTDPSLLLLLDIRDLLRQVADHGVVFTADLLAALQSRSPRPWEAWANGTGLTATALAELLLEFGVSPAQKRRGDKVQRGYGVSALENAIRCYIGDAPLQRYNASTLTGHDGELGDPPASDPVRVPSVDADAACSGVAACEQENPDERFVL
jgi:hypothetical protein